MTVDGSPMSAGGGRTWLRLLAAGMAYAALALFLGRPLVAEMHRILLLPPIFLPLAHGLLVVVGVVVLLAAWRYPNVGDTNER